MLFINQSLIRYFLYRGNYIDHCPARIKEEYYDKTIPEIVTEPMTKGKFFETLVLGKGKEGEVVTDLPRKIISETQKKKGIEIGEKKIDQVRIEYQAEKAKELAKTYFIHINSINTQIKIYKQWKEKNVILVGNIDLFSTVLFDFKKTTPDLAIIDLKLTADLENTWGAYCYGNPHELDMIQGKMYHYLVRDIDLNLNHIYNPFNRLKEVFHEGVQNIAKNGTLWFLLWVFDYKKDIENLDNKFISYKWTQDREQELHEDIRKVVEFVKRYNDIGWYCNPTYLLCKKCPLKDSCKEVHVYDEV